jgi:hypothetical protein
MQGSGCQKFRVWSSGVRVQGVRVWGLGLPIDGGGAAAPGGVMINPRGGNALVMCRARACVRGWRHVHSLFAPLLARAQRQDRPRAHKQRDHPTRSIRTNRNADGTIQTPSLARVEART